eukprot:6950664-Prymnesium_polylepis.1
MIGALGRNVLLRDAGRRDARYNGVALNVAFVGAAPYLEETAVAPLRVLPRIGFVPALLSSGQPDTKPNGGSNVYGARPRGGVDTVADNLDRVAAERLGASCLGVHATLVGEEIVVDSVSDRDRPLLHELLFHVCGRNERGRLGAVYALVLTAELLAEVACRGRDCSLWWTRGERRDAGVVVARARWDRVRVARVLHGAVALLATGENVLPHGDRVAALAAHVLVLVDADPVLERLDRAKSKARTASALISDSPDRSALRVDLSRVIVSRKVTLGQAISVHLERRARIMSSKRLVAMQICCPRGVSVGWHLGAPCARRVAVHFGDDGRPVTAQREHRHREGDHHARCSTCATGRSYCAAAPRPAVIPSYCCKSNGF